jgi:6,7-dimethyl-8-ribityllumazine synthase
MYNVKTKVIPVTMGVIGTLSKSFRKHRESTTGNTGKALQETAILRKI